MILGGTSEATALACALAGRAGLAATVSLAGRTTAPTAQTLPTRVGGFGGVDGLADYLQRERVDVLVDATHPFAAQISSHAKAAAERTGCPLVVVGRPPWRAEAGDDWRAVDTIEAAVEALGTAPRRVFLTIGRLQLAAFAQAPQHAYLVRTIDPVEAHLLPDAHWIAARGPFDADAEEALMRAHRTEVLVSKNSGGSATAGKLAAARRLGVPVILVRRPDEPHGVLDVEAALVAIEAHRGSARRGV